MFLSVFITFIHFISEVKVNKEYLLGVLTQL